MDLPTTLRMQLLSMTLLHSLIQWYQICMARPGRLESLCGGDLCQKFLWKLQARQQESEKEREYKPSGF